MDSVIHHGECVAVMRAELASESIDSIVTDPPYGLGFMGREWDHGVPGADFWREALRVAKPGAFLAAFGGTRTFHRLICAIEDAGWEIRDCLNWLYGSGFPKSKNLDGDWQGWGTALKPAWEPIILARKPLRGTVAANVQAHGTGALNIDGCRIETGAPRDWREARRNKDSDEARNAYGKGLAGSMAVEATTLGRWPANVLHDGSEEVLACFPAAPGRQADTSAARFFYCAKATRRERGEGNDHPTVKPVALMRWLCRLVTPPGGLVLDQFVGSGSTGVAARLEGFRFVGIDREQKYAELSRRRIAAAEPA